MGQARIRPRSVWRSVAALYAAGNNLSITNTTISNNSAIAGNGPSGQSGAGGDGYGGGANDKGRHHHYQQHGFPATSFIAATGTRMYQPPPAVAWTHARA